MMVHFLTNYNVLGKAGNRIRIKGEFPDMKEEDFVFLHRADDYYEQDQAYKIEQIEYNERENYFNAVIAAE